jgi:hypothetical protein
MNSVIEYASSLGRQIKWHGNHNENEAQVTLKAGQLYQESLTNPL